MNQYAQPDLIAQKIKIERGAKLVLMVLLIGLPVLSAIFNLVSWLRFGVDLPYLDDIRPYYTETAGSLRLKDLFTPSNDTLYPLGMALDSIAFRLLSGNTIAYQAISMVIVLGGMMITMWKLLEYCLTDKLLSAAAFSCLLLMLQPDSYWGLQNMAYHQALPILFILIASLVSISSIEPKFKYGLGGVLALASGLVYISGAFAFLAFSLAMLIRECFSLTRSKQVIRFSAAMLIPSIFTTLLQGWVVVIVQHGVHRADTKMSYPWELDFWVFILSKIARSLYLPEKFPLLSLGLAACGLLLLVVIPTISLLGSRRFKSHSALSRVSFVAFPIFTSIIVYLCLVAAGRANFHPVSIDSSLELFTFSFSRFHFFWVCAAWPLVLAYIFAALHESNKVFAVSIVLMMFFISPALFGGTDIKSHKAYYKQTYDLRIENMGCLIQGNQQGGSFQCPGVHPGIDMSKILGYARYKGASFAGLATAVPTSFGGAGALYDMHTDGFQPVNLTLLDGAGQMSTGDDPMLVMTSGKLSSLRTCRQMQVHVRITASRADLAQLFYAPTGEAPSQHNSSVKPVGAGINDLTFDIAAKHGLESYLRFDPVTGAQTISVKNLEVRCLYSGKTS